MLRVFVRIETENGSDPIPVITLGRYIAGNLETMVSQPSTRKDERAVHQGVGQAEVNGK